MGKKIILALAISIFHFTFLIGQSSSRNSITYTYIVVGKEYVPAREKPNSKSKRIGSLFRGSEIEVYPYSSKVNRDTIEGMPGNWRKAKIKRGQEGYIFDQYLVKQTEKTSNANNNSIYLIIGQEKRISGLKKQSQDSLKSHNKKLISSEIALQKKTQERNRQTKEELSAQIYSSEKRLSTKFITANFLFIGLFLGTLLLGWFLKRRLDKLSVQIEKMQDKSRLNEQILTSSQFSIEQKFKDFVPNIIELIAGQLTAFSAKINREFEKKSHIKTVIIEQKQEKPNELSSPDIETETANWQKQTNLFSSYLVNGFSLCYSSLPSNDYFFGRKITTGRNEASVYELRILESNAEKAIFRLIDDSKVIEQALKHPKEYIFPACEIEGTGKIKDAKYIEYTYGIAQKEENNWKIIQKGKLRYYLTDKNINSL